MVYFHASLWYLEKILIKAYRDTTKSVKMNIYVDFFFLYQMNFARMQNYTFTEIM